MFYFCITPERERKTRMMMDALARGWHEPRRVVLGEPPDDGGPFAVWGQEWLALRIIPHAVKKGRAYYHLDNGYWRPARGGAAGYYRVCYRSMTPVLLDDPVRARGKYMGDGMRPWRTVGRHVLLAVPGRHFGLALGIDNDAWTATAEARIRQHTDRPIRVRPRDCLRALEDDLRDCWALVTHSSNVATDAVALGIPVFVEPTSPAAPVGSLDLADLERPRMPAREEWWSSLMSQQFSLQEMRDGTAFELLRRVRKQVERKAVSDGVHV